MTKLSHIDVQLPVVGKKGKVVTVARFFPNSETQLERAREMAQTLMALGFNPLIHYKERKDE